eukprot:Lankesteria_metandrocarpae@DN9417_c0_g1_i1.p1
MNTSGRSWPVAESTVLALHYEMISYLSTRCGHKREAVVSLLEELGFNTGVRLVERLLWNKPRIWEHRECVKFICKELWTYLFHKQADRLQTNRRGGYLIFDSALPWLKRVPRTSDAPMVPTFAPTGDASSAGVDTLGDGDNVTTYNLIPPPKPITLKSLEPSSAAPDTGTSRTFDDPNANILITGPLILSDPSVHLAFACGLLRGVLTNLGLPCQVFSETTSPPSCSFQMRIIMSKNEDYPNL